MSITGMDISSGVCANKGKLGRRKRRKWLELDGNPSPSIPFCFFSNLLPSLFSNSLALPLIHLFFFLFISFFYFFHFPTFGGVSSEDLHILGVFFISLELHYLRQVLLYFLFMGCTSISFLSSPFHYKKLPL